ncbi:hypothetical protein VIGAN_06006900 [Vigna angularis var. angularis]|uniref:Uncharacterized protein n=1 Tax=Vigna angularis var. angularis TaxID=157739 RepID=A0A0S3S8K2_PHAAN|nr:hypothetical protein VIGAN_06006900 [Vigna angularis var. angularis]
MPSSNRIQLQRSSSSPASQSPLLHQPLSSSSPPAIHLIFFIYHQPYNVKKKNKYGLKQLQSYLTKHTCSSLVHLHKTIKHAYEVESIILNMQNLDVEL